MELLNKFLLNQITLPEFLEKAEGKVYRSSKEGIELITTGLEKAIEVFNESNIDYIRIERENRDSIIGYTITYYNIKQIKETYTTKKKKLLKQFRSQVISLLKSKLLMSKLLKTILLIIILVVTKMVLDTTYKKYTTILV